VNLRNDGQPIEVSQSKVGGKAVFRVVDPRLGTEWTIRSRFSVVRIHGRGACEECNVPVDFDACVRDAGPPWDIATSPIAVVEHGGKTFYLQAGYWGRKVTQAVVEVVWCKEFVLNGVNYSLQRRVSVLTGGKSDESESVFLRALAVARRRNSREGASELRDSPTRLLALIGFTPGLKRLARTIPADKFDGSAFGQSARFPAELPSGDGLTGEPALYLSLRSRQWPMAEGHVQLPRDQIHMITPVRQSILFEAVSGFALEP
jgi:hypothetical protein